MKMFVVNSDVPVGKIDVPAWVLSIPKMLAEAKVKDVKYKSAYCCTPDKKVIVEFESSDKDTLKKGLTTIGMPFTAVMEATKV